MDIGRFLELLQDPQKKQADLVEMRNNALKKGAIEHMHLAERVLDERFPSWRSPRTRRGGSKPTNVMFLGKTKHFPSEKEAYVWLMEEFTQHYPQLFEKIDWQTRYVAKGPRALYFAKSLKQLFHSAPDHGIDPNKYHRLMNGWYAKLVLSERQKVELLMKFATVANLRMGAGWDWDDRAKGAPQLSADEFLVSSSKCNTPNEVGCCDEEELPSSERGGTRGHHDRIWEGHQRRHDCAAAWAQRIDGFA